MARPWIDHLASVTQPPHDWPRLWPRSAAASVSHLNLDSPLGHYPCSSLQDAPFGRRARLSAAPSFELDPTMWGYETVPIDGKMS